MRCSVLLLVAPLLVACGGSDEVSREPSNGPETPPDEPGTLPQGCSKSGFDGDELCIAAPEPSRGLQLHVGPSSYDDEAQVMRFLLAGHEEKLECYTLKTPNTETFYYFEQQNRMRPGSHHMIIRVLEGDAPTGWGNCERAKVIASIPGSQTMVRNFPTGELAPENAGFGRTLPPNSTVQFELHYVNTGSSPLLREAWVNLYYKDPALITGMIRTLSMIGGIGMNIAPHTQAILNHSCQVSGNARVYELFGHFHAHTERFSAWRTRAGNRELLYESYNWSEPANLVYDTVNENPAPSAEVARDGGWSGPLDVQVGDTLEWECDVNNTLDTPLRFANEAYTAEMCVLFGGYVADAPIGISCIVP